MFRLARHSGAARPGSRQRRPRRKALARVRQCAEARHSRQPLQKTPLIMTVNSKPRQYYVKIPDDLGNKHPYRLIFTLHASGGNANTAGAIVSPNCVNNSLDNPDGEDITFIGNIVKDDSSASTPGAFQNSTTGGHSLLIVETTNNFRSYYERRRVISRHSASAANNKEHEVRRT
ncbi:hypothetical protein QBC46DRAFT_343690 [Diplogelasinospora grovesii]|uniref:Uncharacterized protein n=1 Tax=Diplogelasinospora grovesii TaxID=303347 RepID=A0AAN6N3U5_9PEZI|nr:hypothetical protein QBC46DRAFT_343690 [Diplogelasinospora grovesii]